jgi:Tfp pilus assembly protein PilV
MTRGFSLLEVVFAASILIVGLTSTAGVYATVSSSFAHQRDVAIATAIAETFMEQVAVLPQSSPLLTSDPHPSRAYDAAGRRVPGSGKFTMSWEVVEGVPVAGIKEITVDVRWASRRSHQVTLFTYRE